MNDRLFITQDIRGADTEVFWRAASSGIGWPDDSTADGSILINNSTGDAHIQARTDDGLPLLIVLTDTGVRFFITDDYADPSPDAEVFLKAGIRA